MASILATLITSKSSQIPNIPKPFVVEFGREISIGRGSKCDLVYADAKPVSHIHCHVRNQDRIVEIKDVSSNRTLVDGKPIPKQEWVALKDGSEVLLAHEPKVKFEVRIGSEPIYSAKRKSSSKHRTGAIAEITSDIRQAFEFLVIPPHSHSDEASTTIGRSKECDVRLEDKKISSVHCKLHFKRAEGESVHWSLEVQSTSKNKTYIGTNLVEDVLRIETFEDPIKISFIYPEKEKAVEILTISPIVNDSVSSPELLTAADLIQQELEKEEKRRKKELHQLEKQGKEWQIRYKQDIDKLQETEHSVLLEIENLNKLISNKQKDLTKLRETVEAIESEMKRDDDEFKNDMTGIREEHEQKLSDYTSQVNGLTSKLQKLNEEKLKIQMGLSQ